MKIYYNALLLSLYFSNFYNGISFIEKRFQRSFNQTCLKYDFVKKYWNSLLYPNGRYVVFVLNEPGLKNGGLGDRIGGILTAMMMSLRFNRTLLIQSSNGFDELFRPYSDPSNNLSSYITYKNCLHSNSWSKYNPLLSDHDETERDLYFCINRNDKDTLCGLDNGDVEQPIIKLRGNRAYICKWATHSQLKAYQELKSLGIDEHSDLLEVSGCLLRLSMWPTPKLFSYSESLFLNLITDNVKHMNFPLTDFYPKFLVGIHYRCGDISFTNPSGADRACQHDESGKDPHPEVIHMKFGTPIEAANCARQVFLENNHLINAISENFNLKYELYRLKYRDINIQRMFLNNYYGSSVYISSDSQGSSKQINDTLKMNNSIITPKGCHIQLNPSNECLLETTSYWLLLSLSDFIVTQTENRLPISAYSRYAAMYGLKKDSLRDAKNCSFPLTRFDMSRLHQGNWFCK